MTIDSNRCEMNVPHWYSRAGRPTPMEPHDHPEPSGAMRRIDRVIAANASLLDRLSDQQKSATEWKTLWLCEVMRGDHEFEEIYRCPELDRAREKLAFWDKTIGKDGSITAEYQS